MDFELVCKGLGFPEGPIALTDGSVLFVEMKNKCLSRFTSGGRKEIVANLGGGPNGAALGPDGALYITNNGGFEWLDLPDGTTFPHGIPTDYVGGSIQRVDLRDGSFRTIYTECDGQKLKGPNDLVFDADGGFYFTDYAKSTDESVQFGALYYGLPDGSHIVQLRRGLWTPNGVAMSPDGGTVYISESYTGRLWAFDVEAPGVLKPGPDRWQPGRNIWSAINNQWLDSMAVEENGDLCVTTVNNGGIAIVSPDGRAEHVPMPEFQLTNICFGGVDMRTAWITAGGSGKLYKTTWPRPGLRLNFDA